MKNLLFLSAFLFAASAQAHFKIGFYDGTYEDGGACSFEIQSKDFKGGVHHPLNEIVSIAFNQNGKSNSLTFTHLALVNVEAGTVRPKPEVLSSVWATDTGAAALELHMNHDGPFQMVYLRDNYKDANYSQRLVCSNLKFRE